MVETCEVFTQAQDELIHGYVDEEPPRSGVEPQQILKKCLAYDTV